MRQTNPVRATGTRAVLAAGLALLLAVAPTGCSSTPGVSNGSVNVCYRAIPAGRTAVHDRRARLIGVHRVPLDQVRSRLPKSKQSELDAENDTAVCAMSFRGTFGPGQVDMAPADQQGPYALVLVSSKRLHLVGAVVLQTLPQAFRGRFF